jgi:HEAT repeat protein
LTALFMGIAQLAAQESASLPTLAAVRERVKAGELDVAWSLVQKVPETTEVVREGIAIAIGRQDVRHAVEWYERLNRRVPAGDPELLSRIGVLRAQQLLQDPDPRVAVEACRAEHPTRSAACLATVRRIADDANAPAGARLAAAGVLVDARDPAADGRFQQILQLALTNDPAVVADALTQRPSSGSLQPLMSIAENSNEDARYLATLALIRLRSKETAALLRSVATDKSAGAARLIAYIGLAAIGDGDALKIVNETLPLMKGRDLLETGKALVDLKDARGLPILRSVATDSEHELLRLEAAEALSPAEPDRAATIVRSLSSSDNPWIRARALEAAARLKILPTPAIRLAMLDANSWVAVRAVQAVIANPPTVSR